MAEIEKLKDTKIVRAGKVGFSNNFEFMCVHVYMWTPILLSICRCTYLYVCIGDYIQMETEKRERLVLYAIV